MYGLGDFKGLGITLKHFINTFVDDLKYFPSSTFNEEAFDRRQGPDRLDGLFTVEYPEVKLKTPENFRFIPFLISDYDVAKDAEGYMWDEAKAQNRCTSCGICSKVCPPQCIWIVRTNDPKTGKPIPQPAEFYIDTDICMNCGYCAEFCPFDAIKMDHDFELADYEREVGHVHNLQRLLKPVSYYASIRPTWNAQEEAARQAAEEEKRRKEEAKKRKAAEKAAAKAAEAAAAAEAKASDDKPAAKPKRSPEEIKAQREAMLARKAAKAAGAGPKTETPAAEPAKADDLTKIEGVGPKIAGVLAGAGIATYAQLGNTDVSKLREIMAGANLRVPHDPTSWPQQAQLAAAGKWDELQALQDRLHGGRIVDDFTKIEGVGPKINEALRKAGITSYSQLGATDARRLRDILEKSGMRVLHDPTTWPKQAQLAAAGKWDELKTLQDELHGGRVVDDFSKIEGIGPKINEVLKNGGITSYAQLGAMDVDKLKEILANSDLRVPPDPGSWPEQDALAAEGKWDELQTLQDELHGGRRKE